MAGLITYTRGKKYNPFKTITWKDVFPGLDPDDMPESPGTIRDLYHEVSYLHRAVNLRAGSLASMPWFIDRGDDNVIWTSEDDMPPKGLEFVDNLVSLLYKTEAALALMGRGYMLKGSEDAMRVPDQLLYWNPLTVTEKFDRGEMYYQRVVQTKILRYEREDVIATYMPDPFSEVAYGGSDGLAAQKPSKVLRAMEGFLDKHLSRGLIKATMLTIQDDNAVHYPEDELQNLKDKFKKMLGGWRKGGEHAIFNAPVKPEVIGEGLKELNNSALTEEMRQSVAAAMAVPYSLLSSSASNYATKQSDQVDFYRGTVVPQARLIAESINRQLFEGLGLRLRFDHSQLEIFQKAELEKAEQISKLVGGPVLKLNEGRELLGYDPIPGGDSIQTLAQLPGARAPRQIEQGGTQEMNDEARQELRAWKKKALSKGADTPFDTKAIDPYTAGVIKMRLQSGERIGDAFEPPFVGF